MIQRGDVRGLLRRYIEENFLYMRPGLAFADTDSLLTKGVIDSLGVMELVGYVEETWGLAIPAEDVTQQHFGTLAGIAAYVAARTGAAA